MIADYVAPFFLYEGPDGLDDGVMWRVVFGGGVGEGIFCFGAGGGGAVGGVDGGGAAVAGEEGDGADGGGD